MLARWFFWFLFVLIAVQPLRVGAHDHDQPDLDAWFKGLTNQINGSCCDGSDAFSVLDVDWKRTSDPEWPYEVKFNGQVLRINKTNVVKGNNRVGISKLWPVKVSDENGEPTSGWAARCFMPGTEI